MIKNRFDPWVSKYYAKLPLKVKTRQIKTRPRLYTLDSLVVYFTYQNLYYAYNN